MRRTTITMLVVAVLASACSSSGDATTTTAQPAGETTTTLGGGGGGDDTTTTTAAPSEATTTTAAPAGGGLDECVVGVWELDADNFFEILMQEMAAEEDVGEFQFIGGAYRLTVSADGTFSNERDNWTFGVASDYGDLEMTIDDVQTGTWTLDGDVLSTVSEPSDPPVVTMSVDGVPFTPPGGVSPISPPSAEFTGATVTCDGDTLTAMANDFTSIWTRVG